MTKRIINLLFFIVLNVFAASLSGIIPLFSHSANAEAGLAILSVTCQPYDGLIVATNDESPDFRIDENSVALFDGDKKIGLSVGECTPVACGEVGIPLDSSFSAPDKLKVVFGKGFAVSENGARLADEEIWIYESFEEEFSLIRFRKESPADDDPDEFADESVSEESITESESESLSESESFSESESESLSENETSSESESEDLPESESSSESESESLSESERFSESESESLSESESSSESESESLSESESSSESESESLPESESSSESESESLSESESSSESESESGNDESESLPESKSSSESEIPPTSESRTKDESNRTPTSENRESGCKSDIYPCMTTGLFATFTASAFIFFNNKKQ